MEQEFQRRTKRLLTQLQKNNLDAAIFFDRDNIRYFTGLQMNQSAESVLIIEQTGHVAYVVARLDLYRARRDCWIEQIDEFLEDTPDYLAPIRKMIKKSWKTLGIEKESITLQRLSYVKAIFPGNLQTIDPIMENLRKVKSNDEIDLLKKAAEIARLTMNATKEYMTKNEQVTEREATGFAKYIMDRNGAENYSFEPFMMSGTDSALPRRVSTSKTLMEMELIVFDMGCIYQGYCSDMTRTFCLGKASEQQKEIFNVAKEAQQLAIQAIKPGVMAHEVDKIARDFIVKHGYGEFFPHLTGHGLGIGVHEYPIIDEGEESVLMENMIVTIEPGVYVPGVGATRIEDMILVTRDGHESLTSSSRDMLI